MTEADRRGGSRPIVRWTRSGGWAVADRGLFSLANFLVSLLLARWLSESAYGSFALALAVFLLAGALHGGWVTEPLLVFGSSRYRERFGSYLGFVLRRHAVFSLWTVLAGLMLAGAAMLLGRMAAATAVAVAALAAPWILLQWLARLACYSSVGPRRAAVAGAVQLLLILGGLAGLRRLGGLSTESAFVLLGITGGLTGLVLVASLRPRFRGTAGLGADVRALHRRYGGWAGATGLLTWIPGQVYYVVLPVAGATAAAGNLRALMNLVLPLMQGYVAISTVLTTALARARSRSPDRFRRIVRVAVLLLGAGAVLYAGMLVVAGPAVMHWLYEGRYDHLAWLLPLVGALPVLGIGATVIAPALRALERPDRVFVAYAVSTAVSLTLGLWLTVRFDVAGAALALAASTAVTTAVLAWILGRERSGMAGYGASVVPPVESSTEGAERSVPVGSTTMNASPE